MQLNRVEFLKAVKFLKPAIMKCANPVSESHLHVVVDGPRCVMTAYNTHIGKRATLFKPMLPEDIEKAPEDIQEQAEFLINLPTLESFETLCQKHNGLFGKSGDLSLKSIDIFPGRLESFKDFVKYEQPVGAIFPDIGIFFSNPLGVYSMEFPNIAQHMVWNFENMIDCMKEFNGHVDVVFTGSEGPIYFKNENLNYEAVFMPVKRSVKDE